MPPLFFFVAQLLWLSVVWGAIVGLVVWPRVAGWAVRDRLSLWIAPEMFRVLGLGLLVPNLSPGMPLEFALATAIGDGLTSVLALSAFVALRTERRFARALVWAATIVGLCDLLVAFPHAARTGAIAHLEAQWYVPVVAGPIMLVAHVACLVTLLRTR